MAIDRTFSSFSRRHQRSSFYNEVSPVVLRIKGISNEDKIWVLNLIMEQLKGRKRNLDFIVSSEKEREADEL